MGYGGLINKVIDPFGVGDTAAPQPANPKSVGRDFASLLQAYTNAQPSIYGSEQTYKPQYAALDVNTIGAALPAIAQWFSSANSGARTANVGDVNALGPGAAAGVSGVYNAANPDSAALLKKLTESATSGLQAGSQLAPQDVYNATQPVQADYAQRGLFNSDAARLAQALGLATQGQGLLNQRQQFAQQTYGQNAAVNQFQTPLSLGLTQGESQAPGLATAVAGGAGPTIISPASTYDMFNTAYNARTASNIAGANNAAASANSY
jgi:hypothetical protein